MRRKEEDEEEGGGTGPMLLCSTVCSLYRIFFFLSPSVLRKEYCKQSLIFIIHNTLNIPPYPCIYFKNKRPHFCESDSLNIICIIFHLYSYSGEKGGMVTRCRSGTTCFFSFQKTKKKRLFRGVYRAEVCSKCNLEETTKGLFGTENIQKRIFPI